MEIYKKSLGQHFLRCSWVAQTMIKAAKIGSDDTVLEIGPGTGILTRALAKYAKKVIAVEKDERLAEELKKTLQTEHIKNVEVITGDILNLLKSHFNRLDKFKIVANIPYYLTSRLIRILLETSPPPEVIVLTIQKEVAQRIVAKPPKMNLLALSVQAFSTPKIIKTVPAECFYPKPKVDSSIILLSDISDKFFKNNKINPREFFNVLKSAFSQKRKLLTNTLKNIADLSPHLPAGYLPYVKEPKCIPERCGDKNSIELALKSAGLKKTARPQEISLKQWLDIIQYLEVGPPDIT